MHWEEILDLYTIWCISLKGIKNIELTCARLSFNSELSQNIVTAWGAGSLYKKADGLG